MKLAFSRPTRDIDEQQQLFTRFREVGYAGLQLKQNQYRDMLDAPAQFLAAWGEYPGVAAGLIFGSSLDSEGVTALRAIFPFAGAVGADRVVYWPRDPAGASDAEMRQFARTLTELGKEARQAGTTLSLHHHASQIVMTREDLDRFFAAAESGSVGLTVDTAHLVKSGIDDVAGVIRDYRQVLDNIHLKDFADGAWRVLGEGGIDFAPIFAAIRAIGYTDWVCADEESGGDLVGGMQACYRYMESGLNAAP
jgi:inosose dehydratase